MTNQIKGIEILIDLLTKFGEQDSMFLHLLDDDFLALGGSPGRQEIIQRCILIKNVFLGIVNQAFGNELAIPVHVLHHLFKDGNRLAANQIFLLRINRLRGLGRRIAVVSLCRIEIFVLFTRAIEVRVIEQASNITEVKNCEVKFTKVLTHTSTTTDNLLELGHRADIRIQNNVFDRLNINAGGQQLGCGNQYRVLTFYITEIIKLINTSFIIGGNSHNVAFINRHHVGVFIHQRPTHSISVFLINTEEDGFIHSAIMLLQIIRDCFRN